MTWAARFRLVVPSMDQRSKKTCTDAVVSFSDGYSLVQVEWSRLAGNALNILIRSFHSALSRRGPQGFCCLWLSNTMGIWEKQCALLAGPKARIQANALLLRGSFENRSRPPGVVLSFNLESYSFSRNHEFVYHGFTKERHHIASRTLRSHVVGSPDLLVFCWMLVCASPRLH